MTCKICNQATKEIFKLEKEGKAWVISPEKPLKIDRFEKNRDKLLAAYHQGFVDGEKFLEKYREVFKK